MLFGNGRLEPRWRSHWILVHHDVNRLSPLISVSGRNMAWSLFHPKHCDFFSLWFLRFLWDSDVHPPFQKTGLPSPNHHFCLWGSPPIWRPQGNRGKSTKLIWPSFEWFPAHSSREITTKEPNEWLSLPSRHRRRDYCQRCSDET